jgi:hypothetical protein
MKKMFVVVGWKTRRVALVMRGKGKTKGGGMFGRKGETGKGEGGVAEKGQGRTRDSSLSKVDVQACAVLEWQTFGQSKTTFWPRRSTFWPRKGVVFL